MSPISPLPVLGALYFLTFGGLGALFPFLPLLLSRRGLTPSEISWVMLFIPLFTVIMPPLWGAIADAFHARVQLLRLTCFGSAFSVLLLMPDWGFSGALLAIGVFALFRSPLTSLADAAVNATMGPKGADFGRVRVWGSAGFALFVLLLGLLKGSIHSHLLLGSTCAIFLVAGFVSLALRPPPWKRERRVVEQTLQILISPAMVLFLLGNTCYYFGHGIHDAYYSLYLRSLGFSDTFVGVAWSVGATTEIVVMLVGPTLLRHFRSSSLLCACGVTSICRWILISNTSMSWILLTLQTLHAVTFGLWYLSVVLFIQKTAPEHLRTSLQSAGQAAFGLGATGGYLTGGQIFHRLGGAWAYRAAAGAAGAALLCYGRVSRIRDRDRGRSAEMNTSFPDSDR